MKTHYSKPTEFQMEVERLIFINAFKKTFDLPIDNSLKDFEQVNKDFITRNNFIKALCCFLLLIAFCVACWLILVYFSRYGSHI